MINQAHASYPFLLAVLVGTLVGYHFSNFELFIIMLSAWFPDFDYMIVLLKKQMNVDKHDSHHRFITHAPLAYIPVLAIIAYFDLQVALLILYGLLTHFVMDSLVAPDGIRWFYPFNKKYFVWTKYTSGVYNVVKWVDAYKKLPVYYVDNTLFIITIILVIYFVSR